MDLTPESIAEAAMLVRFGMNHTSEIRYAGTTAYKDGFEASIVIGKKQRATSMVAGGK